MLTETIIAHFGYVFITAPNVFVFVFVRLKKLAALMTLKWALLEKGFSACSIFVCVG